MVVTDSVSVYVRAVVWRWPLFLLNDCYIEVSSIESKYDEATEKIRDQHSAFGAGGIITSAALLESISNTIIFDIEQGTPAKDKYDFDVEYVQQKILDEYDSIYSADKKESFIYEKTEKKFDKLLEFTGSSTFNRGEGFYQEVGDLITFRNHTVHAKPENVPHSFTGPSPKKRPTYEKYSELSGALKGKAEKSPYASGPLYEYFSKGYVEWAANSSLQFMDEFYSKIGIDPPYEKAIENLKIDNVR